MDLEITPDQELLRDSVRRFLAEHAPMTWVRERAPDTRVDADAVWKGLADLGITGLLVAEEHGGGGAGVVDMAVVLEEMGRAVHPGPFVASAVGAASLVGAAGTAAERAELLPGLATGTRVGTVALTGERVNRPTASPRSGDGWVLTGEVAHVPDVGVADFVVVAADTGERPGVFVVTPDTPGVTVGSTPTADTTRSWGTLTLAAAPARPLGSGADASAAVSETLDRMVAAYVVDGLGAASRALELSVEYAKVRHQFGRPIGSFQAVQHLCADMLRTVELGRAAAYYACWACDAAEPAERHRAATMAKAFASDGFYTVGASAIQVHGGIGFTWEHDVHLYYKRLLSLQLAFGTTTDHLEELAAIILD